MKAATVWGGFILSLALLYVILSVLASGFGIHVWPFTLAYESAPFRPPLAWGLLGAAIAIGQALLIIHLARRRTRPMSPPPVPDHGNGSPRFYSIEDVDDWPTKGRRTEVNSRFEETYIPPSSYMGLKPITKEQRLKRNVDEFLSQPSPPPSPSPMEAPAVAPSPSKGPEPSVEYDDDDVPQSTVDRLIQRAEAAKLLKRATGRAVILLAMLGVAYFLVVNLDSLPLWGILIVFYMLVFVQLHQTYTTLMVAFWLTLSLFLGTVYAVPYRMLRKQLQVRYGRQEKTLGRVLRIRGVDSKGQIPPTMSYGLWFAWRSLRRKFSSRKADIPSAHEFPLGDPYYLRGNPSRGIKSFGMSIIYQPNTLGIIRRRFHPSALYATGTLEGKLFSWTLHSDGINLRAIPPKFVIPVGHDELTKDAPTYHARTMEPYRTVVRGSLERAAGQVERGVRSDAALAKESVREFTLPSPSVVYAGSFEKPATQATSRPDEEPPAPAPEPEPEPEPSPAPEERKDKPKPKASPTFE